MDSNDPGSFVRELIDGIETNAEADLYLFAGPVYPPAEREFNQCLIDNKSHQNIICFVTTLGGSADVAYQLVRSVRRNYPTGKFTLFVDSICKSAGTLIALGADEIVMSDTAELGPLDVQLQKTGELGEFVSGLTSAQALSTLRDAALGSFENYFLALRFKSSGAISTRMAMEFAAKMVVGLFRPVYAQFDPMRLGENTRSNQIALAYGEKIKTANVKDDTLKALINDYPSHGFVIDRDEASELFEYVRKPTDAEHALGKLFWQICRDALEGDAPLIRAMRDKEDNSGEEPDNCGQATEEQKTGADGGEGEGTGQTNESEGSGSSPKENSGDGEI